MLTTTMSLVRLIFSTSSTIEINEIKSFDIDTDY